MEQTIETRNRPASIQSAYFFDKGAKAIQWEKKIFFPINWLDNPHAKKKKVSLNTELTSQILIKN